MSHVKAGGTAKNLTDSKPKFLGVKVHDGQTAKNGSIIVRQRGTKILPGTGTRLGRDHTIYSIKAGVVKFTEKRKQSFNGTYKRLKVASVI